MAYPNQNIDPLQKDESFVLKYARQAWKDAYDITPGIFYNAAQKYDELKKYATAKQDNERYKKPYVDQKKRTSWVDLDYEIVPIVSKPRAISLGMLIQRQFDIVVSAVDSEALSDLDKYFAEMKVKIMMREQASKMNPELLNSPAIKKQPGEPADTDELKMQLTYNPKHEMAMISEMIWDKYSNKNDFYEERVQAITDIYDLGVGGYKEWLDDSNEPKIRSVRPQNVICSYCRRADFKDATHMGEIISVDISDLSPKFNFEQLKEIQFKNTKELALRPAAKYGRQEIGKVQVLDLEFISNDISVFSQTQNQLGNVKFRETGFKNKNNPVKSVINGKEVPRFSSKEFGKVYCVKWIIGTDYVYDWGIAANQKRDKKYPSKACLSYHMYALDFYNMTAKGIVERLKPKLDDYQATTLKIQNFKNKWLPYILDIDQDALEGVDLGNGGKAMTPMQLIDMLFQTGILLSRKRDASTGNPNYKSVDVIPTGMAAEFEVLFNEKKSIEAEIDDLSGLNNLTNASTPNAKTLVPVAQAAQEGTSNSQFPVIAAEKNILLRAASGLIKRAQMAFKAGKNMDDIINTFGNNSVNFIKATGSFDDYDYGLIIEDRLTDTEKNMLMQDLNTKNAQGMITPDIYLRVKNCRNLKQAEEILAYGVKQKMEADQQNALAQQQQTGNIQIQSTQASEAEKRKTIETEGRVKETLINTKGAWDYAIAKLEYEGKQDATKAAMSTKIVQQAMQQEHERNQAKIEQGIPPGPGDNQNQAGMPDQSGQPDAENQPESVGEQQPEAAMQ